MRKHTPGPWSIIEKPAPKVISDWAIKIGAREIGFFPYVFQFADAEKTCGGYIQDQEMHANARLIAAAPTQHEEMKRYLPIIERAEADAELWARLTKGTGIATANAYRAAIAKAEGGQDE